MPDDFPASFDCFATAAVLRAGVSLTLAGHGCAGDQHFFGIGRLYKMVRG